MSHRCVPWIIAMLAAVPLSAGAAAPDDDYCRRGEVNSMSIGKNELLVLYDDRGEILDANARLPDPGELVSARVVACGESKDGIPLYKVQLNGSRMIWVRTRCVIFKATRPVRCEPSTQYPGTVGTSRNVSCTR